LKKFILVFARIVLPIAIIVWLLATIDRSQLDQLRRHPLDWRLIVAAFAAMLAVVSTSFVRWYLLVSALGLPFSLRDAFRLGFLGYLFNFVSVGSMGGDLFKAVFIAREQPGRRTLAVASVVVDRLIGLAGLLCVTTVALAFTTLPSDSTELQVIRNTTYAASGLAVLGVVIVMLPGFTTGPLAEMLGRVPRLGGTFELLITALRSYRRRPGLLLVAGLMSIAIHTTVVVAVYWLAAALFPHPPTLAEHFVIVPLGNVAGALPFTPVGLGTFEVAMEALYRLIPRHADVSGVTIALAVRLTTIAVAAIGVVVYWTSRREVQQVLKREMETRQEGAYSPPHLG
jgi:uncharacterized membrane protein YbhN (UPF0104 family)